MSGVWGKNITLSIFGESHGEGIGIVINGLPSGFRLDMEELRFEMDRRRPGKNSISTPRNEADEFQILSGYFNERITGTPLCIFIPNANKRSGDYEYMKTLMRPGHADYTGNIKYGGFNDYRGGGHFSGRLTAPFVFAGAVANQILKEKGILITSHILQIGNVHDKYFNETNVDDELIKNLKMQSIPTIDQNKGKEMESEILSAKNELDSVGGTIECEILNVPAGIGSPFFDSVESTLSHLLFSIPAVKGVEFGEGFNFASMKGSKANDEFYFDDGSVKMASNNNGGILGGITDGMPVLFKTVIKPTPSIGKLQKTVNIEKGENAEIQVKGRHDPCIVQRAVPVVEAAAALAILDLFYDNH